MEVELGGKRMLALGERDGIQGPAISACARAAGATVIEVSLAQLVLDGEALNAAVRKVRDDAGSGSV